MIQSILKSFRHLLWRITRYCAWVLVCLIVFYIALAVYFFVGKPNPSVDYLAKLNARAAAAMPRLGFEVTKRSLPAFRSPLHQARLVPPVDILIFHKRWYRNRERVTSHQTLIATGT